MKNNYKIDLINTTEGWATLSLQWSTLLSESDSDSLFLTRGWMESWIQCFMGSKRSLFVLVVRNSDGPVAIAPWYLETGRCAGLRSREIRFLGTPETGSDYLDVIARHGYEKDAANAIYDYLFGAGSRHWDQLSLSDLPAESRFLFHFMNRLDEAGKFSELRRNAYIPRTTLPATTKSYFEGLSARRRARYRKDWRHLEKHGACHITYQGQNTDESLPRFFALYTAQSKHDGSTLNRFLQVLSGKGTTVSLQIDFLVAKERDIAALLHLVYGNTLHLLAQASDKSFDRRLSLGNALIGKCLDRAIEAKVACYDFLKGGEEYKFEWSNSAKASLTLQVGQRNLRSYLCTASRLLRNLAKAILR
ncbi:MAG: GNAT family N-acetyltransferase [Acidiferrobacterales bacterium]